MKAVTLNVSLSACAAAAVSRATTLRTTTRRPPLRTFAQVERQDRDPRTATFAVSPARVDVDEEAAQLQLRPARGQANTAAVTDLARQRLGIEVAAGDREAQARATTAGRADRRRGHAEAFERAVRRG